MATYTIDAEVSQVAITYLFGNLFAMTFGAGIIVACGFYLATTTDRPVFKRVVGAGMAFEVIKVVLAVADTARTFGDGFGNVDRVYALSPLYVAGMIVCGCIACLIQSFYAWRCYRLLGNRIALVMVLGVFVLFCFGSFFAANIIAYTSSDPALFMTNGNGLEPFIYLRLPYIASISIDAMLCGLTLYALYKAQAIGSAQGVGRIIQRLALLTISSNALTTAYCALLLIVSIHYNPAFWSLTLMASDFYMLTLLVWLNQRQSTPEGRRASASGSSSGNSEGSEKPLRPRNVSSSFGSPANSPKRNTLGSGVHVTETTQIFNSGTTDNDSEYDIHILNEKSLV